MTTQHRFHADVVVVLGIDVTAPSQHDAEQLATRIALGRQRLRPADIKNLTVTPMTATEQLDHDNVRLWQEFEALRLGTVSQRQRWECGALPDEELLHLARGELFRAFALMPRRTRKTPSAINHPADPTGLWDCVAHAVNGTIPIDWSVLPDPELTEPQWSALQRIQELAEQVRRHLWLARSPSTAIRIHVREHRGRCLACRRTTADRGALVEIDWAGRTLSREYAL